MLAPPLVLAFAVVFITQAWPAASQVLLPPSDSLFNIHNCSGTVAPAPNGYSTYFSSYGPQITGDRGWESWTVQAPFIGSELTAMTILQWTRGDPASSSSNPNNNGTFIVSVVSDVYENITASVTDKFVYDTFGDSYLSMSIGGNRLSFNGSLGTWGGGGWNVSVNLAGLEIEFFVDPVAPHVLFAPTYGGVRSQVVDGYFTDMPVPRGHVDGTLTYASGGSYVLRTVGNFRHAYAQKPIQDLVSTFLRTTIFVAPYSSVHWMQAQAVGSHEKSESSQLVIADLATETDFTLKYQVTNDPAILSISSSAFGNYTTTFPGCAETHGDAYVFFSSIHEHRNTLMDSAGGRFDYYSTYANGTFWTQDGQLYSGNLSFGVLEVYTSPKQ